MVIISEFVLYILYNTLDSSIFNLLGQIGNKECHPEEKKLCKL